MKHAANAVTAVRIVLLPAVVFVSDRTGWFLALYLLIGLSDVLDGYLARKTNTQSKLGARLDSAADLLWFLVVLFLLSRQSGEEIVPYLPWAAVILVLRCGNMVVSALKYRELVFVHTWGNKLTGFLLFLSPLVIALTHRIGFLWIVCAAALLSAAEETLIHLTAGTPDLNRRSIFFK